MKVLEYIVDKRCQNLHVLLNVLSALICETFQFLELYWKLCRFVP
jgi:hypothetical protein